MDLLLLFCFHCFAYYFASPLLLLIVLIALLTRQAITEGRVKEMFGSGTAASDSLPTTTLDG
jgi:hypothetical protein